MSRQGCPEKRAARVRVSVASETSSPEPRAGPLLADAPQPLGDLRIACPRPHAAWLRMVGRDCDGDVAVLAVHAAAIVELSRSRAPHARRCALGDRFEAGGYLTRGLDRRLQLVRRQGSRHLSHGRRMKCGSSRSTPLRACPREDRVTTRAPRAATSAGHKRAVSWKWPRWLVASCDSKPRASRESGTAMIPALFRRMCTGSP